MDINKLRQSIILDGYNLDVEKARNTEYPQLLDCTYLDHGGTTLYSNSAIQAFSADLCSNMYGNPHSLSPSAQASEIKVEGLRLRVLKFLGADPDEYDIVFCANATAGMKIIVEVFSGLESGFRYRYHSDAHTSLIGIRELSHDVKSFSSDTQVDSWLDSKPSDNDIGLFGWPAQSNFSGRRLPRDWAEKLRKSHPNYYSLFDAAGLVTTAPLNLGPAATAPDFTVLSFYKIFGFPDLGGLIVRRESSNILRGRRYFGGGTIDSVTADSEFYVRRETSNPHGHLEDGTIPFHSIIALEAAMDAYERLYRTPKNVSLHACSISRMTHKLLSNLKHGNGRSLCVIYGGGDFAVASKQGPVIAFNMQNPDGSWIGYREVEKLASVKNIHIRAGGMCNPGGVQNYVGMKSWEIKAASAAGHKCSDDMDILWGKPTGALRVSFGAMSIIDDALEFVNFLEEFYVNKCTPISNEDINFDSELKAKVESLVIYPIKSCAGFKIPPHLAWEVKPHGLAWDREWCLVHLGSGNALSQKTYNKMVFLRPTVDIAQGILNVCVYNSPELGSLQIPLSTPPSSFMGIESHESRVCGDKITALTYNSPHIIEFFTAAIGIPCTIARFPVSSTTRNFKPHLNQNIMPSKESAKDKLSKRPQILLSNESPILMVVKNSVDVLNEEIGRTGGKKASTDVFRANIVVESSEHRPYSEDSWTHMKIGQQTFELLGPCRRCHMICINQETAEKNEEPFVTLSKTRRIDGKILFGQHCVHVASDDPGAKDPKIRVGDVVKVWKDDVHLDSEKQVDTVACSSGRLRDLHQGMGKLNLLENLRSTFLVR
ncbi:pyridoxal phosphate-dependent transferase [Geopyxis carbonaria]|nr:pyridoxal phosphate-dependent transferase [Geopyxis carbonaria]